jgi:acetolactate synthase I/II/III large subunit
MVEPVRHRQTKGAATDMFVLPPPRHTPTLPETHKFRAHGVDPMHATHGRGDLAQIARGFGLNGTKVTSLGQFEGLLREHQAQDGSSLWDVHVDDLIPSRNFRRVHYGEA